MYEQQNEKMLFLEITNACNLNCLHCYNSSGKKKNRELSISKIELIIKNFKKIGGNVVCISGGEPFMRNDIIDIVNIILDNGIKDIRLATNGLLINKNNIDILKNFQIVSISLDGFYAEHNKIRNNNCFDKSVEKIKAIMETIGKDRVEISSVLIEKSLDYFESYVKWLMNLGIKHLNVSVPGVFSKKWTNELGDYVLSNEFREKAYKKIKHISRKYANKINISQTLFFRPVDVFNKNVFNCNCYGDLVPSVGGVDSNWIMGKAYISMSRDEAIIKKLKDIQLEMEKKLEEQHHLFWWEELYQQINSI